jgi:DNA-binding MarR family transcriptional regulator
MMPDSDFTEGSLEALADQWKHARPDVDISSFMITVSILRVAQQIEGEFRQFSQTQFGLGTGDMRILLALRRSGPDTPLRPTDLFRSLLVSSGAVTKQIDRLSQRGLVERIADPDYQRGWLIQLTPEGARVADSAIQEISTSFAIASAISKLSPEERSIGASLLQRLAARPAK